MLVLELGLGMNRKTHDCMRSEVLKNIVTMTQLTTEMGGLMKSRIVKLCSSIIIISSIISSSIISSSIISSSIIIISSIISISIISGSINMIFVMRATNKIFRSSTRTLIEERQEEQKWVET